MDSNGRFVHSLDVSVSMFVRIHHRLAEMEYFDVISLDCDGAVRSISQSSARPKTQHRLSNCCYCIRCKHVFSREDFPVLRWNLSEMKPMIVLNVYFHFSLDDHD